MRKRGMYVMFLVILLSSGFNTMAQMDITHLTSKLKNAAADTQKVLTLDSIAAYYKDINPDTGIIFARQGLELAQELKYTYGEGSLRLMLSLLYGHIGDMDDASAQGMQAVQLFKKAAFNIEMARAYNQLGANEGKRGNYDTATKYLVEAERIAEQMHDSSDLINIYVNLGNVFEENISLDKALEYFNKSLSYAAHKPSQKFLALNDIGIVYGKKGDLERALTYFNAVLEESDSSSIQFANLRLNALMNCEIVYDKMGDHNKAFHYIDQVLALARKYHMYHEEALALVNYGVMESNLDTAKGLQAIRDALTIAARIGSKNVELEAYRNMIIIYEDHKDFKNAFYALDKEDKLSEELLSLSKARQIAVMQASYALEKSNFRIEQLEEINRKDETQKQLILIFAGFITAALFVILFFYRKTIMLNRQLSTQKEELKQLNTVKDKLFSVIGHDLRSPVGSIVSLLSIWETEELSEREKKEVIGHLKGQTRATLETLDKLLYWGQSQMNGISIFQTEFGAKRVIKDSLELLNEQAVQKNITINDNIPSGLQVYADRLQFDFVIRNLLSNAIKFTHQNGTIDINADTEAIAGFVLFQVKDKGVGISPERLKHIFDATGDSTVGTAREKGTNVGLKLCKEYVLGNGGTIWAESEEGKGSTFCFTVKKAV